MKNILFPMLCLALVAACATSPLGRRQLILVSADEMTAMGAASFTDMRKKVPATKDAKASVYVSCVATAVLNEMGGSQGWEIVSEESDTQRDPWGGSRTTTVRLQRRRKAT